VLGLEKRTKLTLSELVIMSSLYMLGHHPVLDPSICGLF
jgi:hypothetical protein